MTMMKTVPLILKMFYLIWSLFKKKSWFKLLLFKLVRSDRGNSSLDKKEMPQSKTHPLICRLFLSPWCRCWGCCRGWGASPRPPRGRRLSGARPGSWWPGAAITATSEEKTHSDDKKLFTFRDTFLYKTVFLLDIHTLNFWISDEGIHGPSGWEFNWDWGWLLPGSGITESERRSHRWVEWEELGLTCGHWSPGGAIVGDNNNIAIACDTIYISTIVI